jgi:hypothetical protein
MAHRISRFTNRTVLIRAARLAWYRAQAFDAGPARARLAAFGDRCYYKAQEM